MRPVLRPRHPRLLSLTGWLAWIGLCGSSLLLTTLPVPAQVESFILKSGSQVGPATEVKPKNCLTAKDGTITCDTELVNPPGNTPAKPQYTPFRN